MGRAIWDGQITFGLINIPVNLYSAEKNNDLDFHMIDRSNGARVRYERVNEATGQAVPWKNIVKGYEYRKGDYVLLDKNDFKAADVHRSQSIDLIGFVEAASIDIRYYEKPYYLVPGKHGEKGYELLRKTLQRTGRVGVAKVVIKTREYLAALVPVENALALEVMRYGNELLSPDELEINKPDDKKLRVSEAEIKMAEQLVASMSMEWKPEAFKDEYQDKLLQWIEKKAKTKGQLPQPQEKVKAADSNVIDLMALLQRSMKQKPVPARKAKKATRKATAQATPRRRRKSG